MNTRALQGDARPPPAPHLVSFLVILQIRGFKVCLFFFFFFLEAELVIISHLAESDVRD